MNCDCEYSHPGANVNWAEQWSPKQRPANQHCSMKLFSKTSDEKNNTTLGRFYLRN